jgi:acyl-CoA thioesterase
MTAVGGVDGAAGMLAADVASTALGIELVEVTPGRAVLRMRVTGTMLNGHRICHGGYLFLFADTAFAVACNTYGRTTVAAGADIAFLRPVGADELLVAEAVERVRYGSSGLYDVTVAREDGTVVAEFRGRSRTLSSPIGEPVQTQTTETM